MSIPTWASGQRLTPGAGGVWKSRATQWQRKLGHGELRRKQGFWRRPSALRGAASPEGKWRVWQNARAGKSSHWLQWKLWVFVIKSVPPDLWKWKPGKWVWGTTLLSGNSAVKGAKKWDGKPLQENQEEGFNKTAERRALLWAVPKEGAKMGGLLEPGAEWAPSIATVLCLAIFTS